MRQQISSYLRPLVALAVFVTLSLALAQEHAPLANDNPAIGKMLTGKERLGEKWTDEQRVDNCKVPVDKRGPKPRPDTCAHLF
jgi:hypothetical protein